MSRNELYQAAQVLARAAINNCPDDLYAKLAEHAIANWSIDIDGMVCLALEQAFGVGE